MRVLIVGGSSSVGQAVAAALVKRGVSVLATFAHSLIELPEGVRSIRLDLEGPDSFPTFAQEARASLGGIDHLILLAGILPGKGLADYPDGLIGQVMGINFAAQAALVRELMGIMEVGGSILAMSSISGQQGSFDPIYAASKAAIIAFMKSLATWHGDKLRFNCIAPGLIQDSRMYDAMSPERREFHRTQTPRGELLAIDDLAEIIVDLLQPRWRHLNGAVVSLTGGRYTAG